VDLEKLNLVINFDIPLNSKKHILNNGCAGQHGFYGIAIYLCTSKEVDSIREFCDEQRLALSLLPKDINPEYFYYNFNPEKIDPKSIEMYSTNNTTSNAYMTNSKKLIIQKGFNFPYIPTHSYTFNSEQSVIDLTPTAIQNFLFDQGEDEEDWFAEELKNLEHNDTSFDKTKEELNQLKDTHVQKLELPTPVNTLSYMMETETWTHPSHTNISDRIKLWRKSIYKINRHLFNRKDMEEVLNSEKD